ncbi:MAG: IPT/TIG domain-containing protein [Bacteroidetes bacterium]|nr:IPT/TIG domain-containing protein [Bacteroidota bacterium]
MNTHIIRITSICLFIGILIALNGCTEYEEPGLISATTTTPSASPVITGISPANAALSGVREITIMGQNFATNGIDTNWIFIGGISPIVKSIDPTQITIYRPANYGDSLLMTIAIPRAMTTATIRYTIEQPIEQFGDFTRYSNKFTVMEFDKNGYLYVMDNGRNLYQVTRDGLYITKLMGQESIGSALATTTDMKFGTGGLLYCVVGNKRGIYRIDVSTTDRVSNPYITLPSAAGNLSKLDFDASGNIFTAGNKGVFRVSTSDVVTETGHYNGNAITELRIIGNDLYVSYGSILSKNVINTDGTLGNDELVVDVSTKAGLSSCTINSFNIDAAGTIFLSLTGNPDYSIFVIESDGSVMPYYKEPSILPSANTDQLIWSNNSRYIYLNRSSNFPSVPDTAGSNNYRLFKMGLPEVGKPYNGRLL